MKCIPRKSETKAPIKRRRRAKHDGIHTIIAANRGSLWPVVVARALMLLLLLLLLAPRGSEAGGYEPLPQGPAARCGLYDRPSWCPKLHESNVSANCPPCPIAMAARTYLSPQPAVGGGGVSYSGNRLDYPYDATEAVIPHLKKSRTCKECVHVFHAPKHNWHMEYMLEPIVATLLEGFKSIGIEADFRLITNRNAAKLQWDALDWGHLLVWVGTQDVPHVPWASLRSRGVYTVLYQIEPMPRCYLDGDTVDELWDYSWHNIHSCAAENLKGVRVPSQRYVPPGALDSRHRIVQKDAGAAKLFFFGNIQAGNAKWGRDRCWDAVAASPALNMRKRMGETFGVWSEPAYEQFLNRPDVGIFYNIHKSPCGARCKGTVCSPYLSALAVRIAKLLNSHALIISEHSYPRDEVEFNGTVSFVNVSQIAGEFKRFLDLPTAERQAFADERAAVFSRRFQPKEIFARAQILGLLNQGRDPITEGLDREMRELGNTGKWQTQFAVL